MSTLKTPKGNKKEKEKEPVVYGEDVYDPFKMSNIVKCIKENDIKDLSTQLRVPSTTEHINVLLFNILNDKPAKFTKWRDCKYPTPVEFKN